MQFACIVVSFICTSFVASVSIHHRQPISKPISEVQTGYHSSVNGSLVEHDPISTEPKTLPRFWETSESMESTETESQESTESRASLRHRQHKSHVLGPHLHPSVFEDTESAKAASEELEKEEDDKYKKNVERIASLGVALERQLGFPIDWVVFKVILGLLLMVPAMPNMLTWEIQGHPPHPFILAEEAVPKWRKWQYDLAQLMSLVGLDLVLLGGVEWNWLLAIKIFRIFVLLRSLQGFIVFIIGVMRSKSAYSESGKGEIDDLSTKSVTVEAENRFQDFSTSVVHLTVLIMAQMTFMSFYTYEMTKPNSLTARAYTYWLAAIPMQIVARGLMGRSFCHECTFWHSMLHIHHNDVVKVGDDEDDANKKEVVLSWSEVLYRSILSFYVNNVSMAWIAWSLPIFTMSAPTDIDFVKDCFAIVFITTLDDLSDTVTITVERGSSDSPRARRSSFPESSIFWQGTSAA